MTETTTEHVISLGAKLDALDLTAEEEAVLDTILERAAVPDEVSGFSRPLDAATNRTGKLALGFGLDPAWFSLDPASLALDPAALGLDPVKLGVSPFGRDSVN